MLYCFVCILSALGACALLDHHVGSTAVPLLYSDSGNAVLTAHFGSYLLYELKTVAREPCPHLMGSVAGLGTELPTNGSRRPINSTLGAIGRL